MNLKVGDKVYCITSDKWGLKKGKIYTVIHFSPYDLRTKETKFWHILSSFIKIPFDNKINRILYKELFRSLDASQS